MTGGMLAMLLAASPAISRSQGYENYDPTALSHDEWPSSGPEFTNFVGFTVVRTEDAIVVSGDSAASSFKTQSDFLLSSVTVPLVRVGGNDILLDRYVEYLAGYLFADDEGRPGAVLATFLGPDAAASRTTPNYDDDGNTGSAASVTPPHSTFELETPYSLTAGTGYWFGIGPSLASASAYDGIDLQIGVGYWQSWMWMLRDSTNGENRMALASINFPIPGDWSYYAAENASLFEGAISLGGVAIPEPETYAGIVGVVGLVFAFLVRKPKRE